MDDDAAWAARLREEISDDDFDAQGTAGVAARTGWLGAGGGGAAGEGWDESNVSGVCAILANSVLHCLPCVCAHKY